MVKLWSVLDVVIPARMKFNSKMQVYDFLIEAMILDLILAASKEKTKRAFQDKTISTCSKMYEFSGKNGLIVFSRQIKLFSQ